MSRKKVQQLDKPPAKGNYPARKIDVAQALKMRLINNLSYAEIGKYFSATPQAVQQALQSFKGILDNLGDIQAYKDNRPDVLTAIEQKMLEQIVDTDKLQKSSLNNVAYAFTQIHNARRLEENKSTANLQGIYAIVQRLDKDERKEENV